MKSYPTKEKPSALTPPSHQRKSLSKFSFPDNRKSSHSGLVQMANQGKHALQLKALESLLNSSSPIQKQGLEEELLQGKFDNIQKQEIEEEELLQGKFDTAQKMDLEEEEPLQSKFETAQREGMEEEELLQGKFDTAQKMSLEEEEPLQGKFEIAQLVGIGEEELLQGKFETIQKQENNTSLPDNLKSGIENLSGYAMDDVKVHYNSPKPATLQAHAYAQGTEIHIASGQEKHLPHEAWHVVQQKQGRVKPTIQLLGKVNVNDDEGLEKEADVMGGRALNHEVIKSQYLGETAIQRAALLRDLSSNASEVFQLKLLFNGVWYGRGQQGILSKQLLDDGSHLPGWNANHLESDTEFYKLNESDTEWVKDQKIEFTRIPKNDNDEKARINTAAHKPEIAYIDDDVTKRVTPKRTTSKTVSKATLIKETKGNDESNWHWTLECEVNGGKTEKTISMDLLMQKHRVFYGSSPKVSKKKGEQEFNQEEYEAIPFILKHPMPVQVVYAAMFEVVIEDGGWTDTIGYNCQNFVLSMLKKLEVSETETLENQARWREDQKYSAEIDHEWNSNSKKM